MASEGDKMEYQKNECGDSCCGSMMHDYDSQMTDRLETRRQIVLNTTNGSIGPLPIITTNLSSPINVVSTAIDTAGMGKTNNLLTFTGRINLPLGISVTMNFQIHRVYNNNTPMNIGSTYTFSTTVNVLEAEAFSFQFMDADAMEGMYTYTVSLSSNSVIDITPGVTISAELSVLALTA